MSARVWAVLFAAGATLGACSSDPSRGYSFTSAHSESIRSIAVPVFKNSTMTKAIEVELTQAILSELRRTTPWAVTGTDGADAVLTGTLIESRLRPLTTGRNTGLVQQMAVVLTVDFDFEDNRTGRTLISRRRFSGVASFVPARPAAERIETGQHAAIQELAQDIVAELRSDW